MSTPPTSGAGTEPLEALARLLAARDEVSLAGELLRAVLAAHGGAMGDVQFIDAQSQSLTIVAHHGLTQEFVSRYRLVPLTEDTACTRAARSASRTVVADVLADPVDAAAMAELVQSGIRAVQSTPLLTQSGMLLGVVSTQFPTPGGPSEDQLRWSDLYARCAAEVLARIRAEETLRKREAEFRATADAYGFILDAFGAVAYDVHLPTGRIRFSPHLNRLYGFPADQIITLEDCRSREHPDDRHLLDSIVPEAREHGRRRFAREFRIVRPGDDTGWVLLRGEVVLGADGHPERVRGAVLDITARKAAEGRLRESESRLAAIFSQAAVGLSEVTRDGTFVRVNDELCRILGRGRADLLGRNVADVTHPEDLERTRAALARRMASGEPVSIDKRYLRPDGTCVEANSSLSLLKDGEGRGGTLLVVTADLTERNRAQERLRESEERFRLATAAAEMYSWEFDLEQGTAKYSENAASVLGFEALPLERDSAVSIVHPEDREAVLAEFRRAREHGGALALEYRIVTPSGGTTWIENHAAVVRNAEGRAVRLIGIGQNITARKDAEEQRKLLVAELDHRVKNTLATVSAMTAQTIRQSGSLAEFETAFMGRLQAFARTHTMLSRTGWTGVSCEGVLRAALVPYGVEGTERLALSGPPLMLAAGTALTLGMIVHELATNASKYGALSTAHGKVGIGWSVGHDGLISVLWAERDGPVVAPPDTPGFGSRFIQRAAAYELGGEARIDYRPWGVECRITFPKTQRTVQESP